MLHIMQDYGEIVCIMGSSSNSENAGIFMQADASIAVEPLYPQVCQKISSYQKPKNGFKSPLDLSRDLNSVACSLCIKREDPNSIYLLLIESRHFVTTLWNVVQFWMSCLIALSLMQLIAIILNLPSIFTPGQLLWICCIVVPFLSISLMWLPLEADVMKKPQGKNQAELSWGILFFITWCYGFKFLPTLITVLLAVVGILAEHCSEFCTLNNCTCEFLYLPSENGWSQDSPTLATARLVAGFIVLLHFGEFRKPY